MAKVSLRSYNREIGTLIDQGNLEEAVGHCNHILKTFPKHLETYRLLGKAYLEAKRYKDASDVFSRLLAAVPNDFVAHVGMSMIADETQNLDDAIWHMERAFEAQPSNAAVQSELQRLYGRRDGVQPPKIRMTSGALANVYVQGELYPQAIAEIMNVEAKEPGRLDMQVLLALAYFRSGQRVEASKMASDILAKSPYNLDANRILVTILPETSRAESTQVYRHRINALDPYATFAKSSLFDTSDVADAAVSLERLDWQPGDTVFKDSNTFTDSSIQSDSSSDEQPDWLKNAATNGDFGAGTAEEAPAQPADNIPDFMRAAGWGTSSGEPEEPVSFYDSPNDVEDDDDDTPIAQAELPDWMKNIAPDQAELEAANQELDEMGDDDMADDFINDLLGSDADDKSEGAGDLSDLGNLGDLGDLGTSSEEQDAALNWLEQLAANQGANPEELITDPNARTEDAPEWVQKAANTGAPATPPVEEVPAQPADDVPDWLSSLGDDDEPAAEMPTSDDVPAWLGELGTDDKQEEDPALPAAESGDLPDWLNEAEDEMPAEETPPAPPSSAVADDTIGTLGTSSDEQDAAMNWLEQLAAKQGANPDELITDPNARTEAAPEWVQKAQDASAAAPQPVQPKKETPAAEELPAAEDDLAWMNELSGEETPAPAADSADDIPDWLSGVEEEPETEEAPPASPVEENLPTEAAMGAVADDTIGTLGTSSDEQDAAMNWLEQLAAKQGANPDELITDPNARTEAAPEWVQKAQDASVATPQPVQPKEETPAAEELPAAEDNLAWMNELSGEETPAPAADSADDIPEWLTEEADKKPESTQEEAPAPAENTDDDVPAWLRDDGFIEEDSAEDVPAWLQKDEQEEQTPAPSMSMQESIPAVIEEAAAQPTADETEDEEAKLFEQAQAKLAQEAPEPTPSTPPTPEPVVDETPAPETPAKEEEEELPEWLAAVTKTESQKTESDDDLPIWLKNDAAPQISTPPQTEPTKAAEWQPVSLAKEEKSAAKAEEKPAPPKQEEKTLESILDLPPRRKVQRMNTTMLRDITLMSAQAAMREGNVTAALAEYGKLIKKKRLLAETIYDLREALYDYPVDISVWQTLGDAYMRAGQLQEAINAYTKAEELLR